MFKKKDILHSGILLNKLNIKNKLYFENIFAQILYMTFLCLMSSILFILQALATVPLSLWTKAQIS